MNPTKSLSLCWRNILFLFGTLISVVVLLPWYLAVYGAPLSLWMLFVVSVAISNLAITAGYHRYLAHRSYEARDWVKVMFLLFGAGAFQGSALQWASDHRRHHREVDTEEDPHNIRRGFFYAHVGWLFFREEPGVNRKWPLDLTRDKYVVWQDRNYVWVAIAVGFGMPFLVGLALGLPFGGFLFGGLMRVVASNHITFLINSLAHTVGTRPYDSSQSARDSLLMAVLAFGEGYHNYHHAFCGDYRNGIRWYHWDPTKWLIVSFEKLGWTYKLRRISPAEIWKIRLINEQEKLIARGGCADRLQALKDRIVETQRRIRTLREEYKRLKRDVQVQSRRHLDGLKLEIKLARLEFKYSLLQWGAYRRTLLAH